MLHILLVYAIIEWVLPECSKLGVWRLMGNNGICVFLSPWSLSLSIAQSQEAYSVARQFNLIPPVCEQAEYHLFQRDKVEMQLPELYHKIGKNAHMHNKNR